MSKVLRVEDLKSSSCFKPIPNSVFTVLLVLVSPCPDFSFKTEECVPAEVVCDFKGDRQDGSDEEFCGTPAVLFTCDVLA